MHKCKACGTYTLESERCPRCGGQVGSPHPPRYPGSEKRLEFIVRYLEEREKAGEERES